MVDNVARIGDAALIAAIVVGLLGALSLWAHALARRGRMLPRPVGAVALVISVAGSALMAWTAVLGGRM